MTGGGYRLLASGQTLEGSFSAVSTATIATKYSFCRVFRDLQDLFSLEQLNIQLLQIFKTFFNEYGAVERIQRNVNLVDLEKRCKMSIWLLS